MSARASHERDQGPLVFAHRGASAELPEHTLQAYLRAIEQGADGLECDVRLTRDGHLVCVHDSRLERTSNGQGRVSRARLDELDRLDFTSWHIPAQTDPDVLAGATSRDDHESPGEAGRERGVLTFDRLVQTALDAGRPLRLLVETKHPTRYGRAVEHRLVEVLRRHALLGDDRHASVHVTMMSFSALAVRRMRSLAPRVPTVFLFDLAHPGVRDGRPPFGAQVLGPGLDTLRSRPTLVERAHARGRQVYVWTVNEEADLRFVRNLGVDGVISDRPAQALASLRRHT
jgi:glycerophosphoryl diester phosphodiesterase